MRWWLNTDHGRFSVDNAVVNGIDCSSLDPTIWMVQWTDGKGEIEHQVDADTNDNGLRETFVDVIPYAPFFQQFLSLCPRLTLTQAKKVDIDLIRQIFEGKRQAPFHYPIAAGDYWWDATDETLMSSTVAAIQNATATLNQVVAALNSVVAQINSNTVAIINQNAGIGNTLVAQINSYLVDPHNNTLNTFQQIGDALVTYINNTMLGSYTAVGTTINWGLYRVGADPFAQGFGSQDVPHTSISWANPYYATYVAPGTFNNASAISYSTIPPVSVANAQWIPIGATAPVTVTPAEQAGILNGITARTNDLNAKKNIKIGQVNALTTVAAVIAYDVTTGW